MNITATCPLAVQRGSIIVVALVVLMAMTLIAASMMSSAILQEQMAGNSRQKIISRYAAEAALSEAERIIFARNFSVKDNMTPLFNPATKGYYSATNLSWSLGMTKTAAPVDFDITDVSLWDENTNSVAVINAMNTTIMFRAPQYIIEYIGRRQPDTEAERSMGLDGNIIQPGSTYFFRVVAIGWGKDPQIYTILQSVYRLTSVAVIDDSSDKRAVVGDTKGPVSSEGGRISWSIIH